MSNAFPRPVGGSGSDDHDRSAAAADRRPPPLFPNDPPPVAAEREVAPARDARARPYGDRPEVPESAVPGTAASWSDPHPGRDGFTDGDRRAPLGPPDGAAADADAHDQWAAAPDGDVRHHELPDRRDAPSAYDAPDEVETPVPVGQRVRGTLESAVAAGRSSVPVRVALLVVPPLVVPPVAFDLSFGATLAVWLLLLWLVGATAVVTTLTMDGADMVAMRAIGRHLERIADASGRSAVSGQRAERSADDEALLIVGEQLDALNDRLDALESRDQAGPIDHRPPEQWSPSRGVVDNDGDDHDVARGRHRSPPRWQR